jgi:hypothetical protein
MCKKNRKFFIEKSKIVIEGLQKKISQTDDSEQNKRLIRYLEHISKILSDTIFLRNKFKDILKLTNSQEHKLLKLKRKSKIKK